MDADLTREAELAWENEGGRLRPPAPDADIEARQAPEPREVAAGADTTPS